MKIKKNSWHYRRYARWEMWKRRYEPRKNLDLCHYTRVVVLWYSLRWPFQRRLFGARVTPIAILAGGIVLASAAFVVFQLTKVPDWSKVGIIAGIVIGGIALGIGIVFAIFYAFDEKKLHVVVRESDTFQLTKGYVKAKKSRVCPILKVED